MPAREPTAAVTSPVAVIAAVLLLMVMILAAVALQAGDSREALESETPMPPATGLAGGTDRLPTWALGG
jgi:hypothetical protein